MPQQPIGLSLTAKGNMSVTRSCAVNGCGVTINAPARFCNSHWQRTPPPLKVAYMESQTDNLDHPTVRAIADWFAEYG